MQIGGRLVPLRLLLAVLGYLVVGSTVIVIVSTGRHSSPGSGTAPVASALRFPAPPPGSLVFAREAGSRALALAVQTQGDERRVQVSLVGQDGAGVSGLDVRIGASVAETCGAGCYRATVSAASVVAVHLGTSPSALTWRVSLPVRPVPAARIVARAAAVWRGLRSVAWTEVLGSDATHIVRSSWRAAAPDRLRYVVHGEGAAVVIGKARWDRRSATGPWQKSVQDPPLQQPVPFWVNAQSAHVVGVTVAAGGRPAWIVSFFDPKTPGWFRLEIDKASYRTLHMDMVATAHFMHDAYSGFDAAPVTSPAGRS